MFWVLQIPTSWTGGVSVSPQNSGTSKRDHEPSPTLVHTIYSTSSLLMKLKACFTPQLQIHFLLLPELPSIEKVAVVFLSVFSYTSSPQWILHYEPLFHFPPITWIFNPKVIISSSIPKCAYTSTTATAPWGWKAAKFNVYFAQSGIQYIIYPPLQWSNKVMGTGARWCHCQSVSSFLVCPKTEQYQDGDDVSHSHLLAIVILSSRRDNAPWHSVIHPPTRANTTFTFKHCATGNTTTEGCHWSSSFVRGY